MRIHWYNAWFYRRVLRWLSYELMQIDPHVGRYRNQEMSDSDCGYAIFDALRAAIHSYERGCAF